MHSVDSRNGSERKREIRGEKKNYERVAGTVDTEVGQNRKVVRIDGL